MSNIRVERLKNEYEMLSALVEAKKGRLEFNMPGHPYEEYIITFHCKGLYWDFQKKEPTVGNKHMMRIILHHAFPALPPKISWLTPIFHPNIRSPVDNGAICYGSWNYYMTLARLCLRIAAMVQYRKYDLSDKVNPKATDWAKANEHRFPVDDTQF